ncbi:MAG: hypothetical protein BWY11_01560 [Firmicutes bacterium ADurb.Bin182]|nr:MAG: hypothetical protein BWY11_01560 [Firmicutes bacterium ADurb.Bin182]
MNKKWFLSVLSILLCAVMLLSGCGSPAPTVEDPQDIDKEPVAENTPAAENTPKAENTDTEPALTIGVLYGGPMTDSGYNQSLHDSMLEVQATFQGSN